MNFHEYQAKALLRQLGVPVPKSKVVLSAAEARNAAIELQRETGSLRAVFPNEAANRVWVQGF